MSQPTANHWITPIVIIVAMIGAVWISSKPGTHTDIYAFMVAALTMYFAVSTKIDTLHTEVNSKMSELLKVTAELAKLKEENREKASQSLPVATPETKPGAENISNT